MTTTVAQAVPQVTAAVGRDVPRVSSAVTEAVPQATGAVAQAVSGPYGGVVSQVERSADSGTASLMLAASETVTRVAQTAIPVGTAAPAQEPAELPPPVAHVTESAALREPAALSIAAAEPLVAHESPEDTRESLAVTPASPKSDWTPTVSTATSPGPRARPT